MAAGPDNSLTQSHPGPSSSPDGCLICAEQTKTAQTLCSCVLTCCPSYDAHCAPHRECVIALALHS